MSESGPGLPSTDGVAFDPAIIEHKLAQAIEAGLSDDSSVRVYDPARDEDMVDYVERELRQKMRAVPKLCEILVLIIQDARAHRIIREAILGPRGGGKTRFAATIELLLWRFFGYDAQNIGGSLKQAQTCYEYMVEGHELCDDLRRFTVKQTMYKTVSRNGNKIGVSAASETSIRGPHPGGDDQGGLVVIDEVAIMKDGIVDAVKGQLTSANPSACLQLSTMGERQGGRWHELINDPRHKGYRLHTFDIFDVSKKCAYECATTCPVKEHFAEDYYHDLGGGKRQFVHKAYCGGKAHDTDGWISIDEIAAQWEDLDSSTFERENLGINTAIVGHVFDPLLIKRACVANVQLGKDPETHQRNLLRVEKAIGHDWGWSSLSAACYMLRLRRTLIVYRWEFWDHTSFAKIGKHLSDTALAERIEFISPDAAEPAANDDMREECDRLSDRLYRKKTEEFTTVVRPVVFSQIKGYGFGEVRRRLERETVLFPSHFGGVPVPNYEKAMGLIRAHQKGGDGKPIKKDDHASDALMCGVLNWSQRWAASPVVG